MSRAFVKEEEGAAWEAPPRPRAYEVLWHDDAGAPQKVFEDDDLLQALRWMSDARRPALELHSAGGGLLAEVGELA